MPEPTGRSTARTDRQLAQLTPVRIAGILSCQGRGPVTKSTVESTVEKITELLRDLPPGERNAILAQVASRLETREWMRFAESGFREWLSEPDLYADEPPAR